MRAHFRLALVVASLILPTVAHASAKPCDTTKKSADQHTLMSSLRIAAFHVDFGGASIISEDTTRAGSEAKLSIALCRWPEWTVALVGGSNASLKTAYAVGSSGYHPSVYVEMSGVAVERRWNEGAMLHPIVTVGAGSVSAEYRWAHYENGAWKNMQSEHSATSYASATAGAELNVTRWMRMDALLGYRATGALHTLYVDPNTARGPTFALHFGLGKY